MTEHERRAFFWRCMVGVYLGAAAMVALWT